MRWSLMTAHPPTDGRLIAIVISSLSTVLVHASLARALSLFLVEEGSEYSLPEASRDWRRKSM